ncbi:DUF11 domain-containing protein [Lysobacter capsici]|uniref:DUF11 domain-containing protein n=1 Tax=Lysobacter capsici TaxID=435897 RepID=UPI00177E2D3D|nr:DUF11 domain-containing protein [Lysobacter capsici]UOF14849.1 DUF11 domain-containing protein [Lysobacter capsici]
MPTGDHKAQISVPNGSQMGGLISIGADPGRRNRGATRRRAPTGKSARAIHGAREPAQPIHMDARSVARLVRGVFLLLCMTVAGTQAAWAQACDPVFTGNPLNVSGLGNGALTSALDVTSTPVVSTTLSAYTPTPAGASTRSAPAANTINYTDPAPASAAVSGQHTFSFARPVPVIFEAGSTFGGPDSNLDVDQDLITFTAIGASPGFSWVRAPAVDNAQTDIEISPDGLTATVRGPSFGTRPGSFAQYRLSTNGTVTGVQFTFRTTRDGVGGNSAQFEINVPTCRPVLTLAKTVINDNGGTALDTAWTLAAAGPTPISGTEGSAAVTNATVSAGTYTLSETGPAGYTQTAAYSCVVNGGAPVVSNTLALPNLAAATCTVTNNDNPATLRLIKSLASRAAAADEFATVILNGGTALAFSPPTSGATPTTASTAATVVPAGVALTLRDAQTSGPSDIASAYTRAISCVAGPGNGSVPIPTPTGPTVADPNAEWSLTMNAGNDVVCTITNTAAVATLQLAKAWAAGSLAGHQVTIGATTGGANNTAGFTATAPTAANSGAPVNVNVGNVITLPAEGGANIGSYSTALACTGGHTLSGTNGQQVNTLTITSANAAVCTYTNTLRPVDLTITKTNTPAAGAIDQATDTVAAGPTTYTLVVTNNGPGEVTGAIVRDAPTAGVVCPPGNAVTFVPGPGVPAGSFTVANLTGAGIALATLAAGQSTTLSFTCTVQ